MTGAAPGGYGTGRTGHSSIPIHRPTRSRGIPSPTAASLARDAGLWPRTLRRFRAFDAPTSVRSVMDEANATAIDSQLRELQFGSVLHGCSRRLGLCHQNFVLGRECFYVGVGALCLLEVGHFVFIRQGPAKARLHAATSRLACLLRASYGWPVYMCAHPFNKGVRGKGSVAMFTVRAQILALT